MSDWWAKRLGGEPTPRQQQGTPMVPQAVPPQQRPMAQVPQQYAPQGQVQQEQPQAYVEGDPNAEVHLGDMLRTKQYNSVPAQAQALTNSGGSCPACQSGNYYTGTASGGGAHCHDCGYPLVQSGSGMGSLAAVKSTGPVQQAQSPTYTQQLGG